MTGKHEDRAIIPGSERPPLPGLQAATATPADDFIEATLVLRRRAALPDFSGEILTTAELAEQFGASPDDIAVVRRQVEDAGAEVLGTNAGSRRVRIAGPTTVLEELFGTSLTVVTEHDPASGQQVQVRARQGSLSVPSELDGIVTAVLGLDNRRQARSRLQVVRAHAARVSYTPVDLAGIYRFPTSADGSGQRVAIIELGGGFQQADLDAYFGELGLPTPAVTAVGVDGANNAPENDASGADGEVLLDIEVVGGMANGAAIDVYFGPNTDAGFLDAVSTAAHSTPTPAAISISWGQSEDEWTEQARTAMDEAFADAVTLGVTVTAAAGDDGSSDRASDTSDHCDFPASSPHVLACGGTTLQADAASAKVTSEVVWNNGTGRGATGGGVSDAFPLPDWQQNAGVPESTGGKVGRGVPDVSAVADPQTGYQVRVDGESLVIGGTSAVAPLWAALAARLAQALDRPLGLLHPTLYAGASADSVPAGFRDIIDGNNGGYRAGPGWDPCTGLGVPDGEALLEALRSTPRGN